MNRYYRFVRMQINKFAKPTAVHTEAIHVNKVWEEVKKFTKKNNNVEWFVITPLDFEFAKAMHGFKGTRKQYERILLERYRWLQENGQRIQLHVHLKYFIENVSKKEQEEKVTKAINWLKANGFSFDKIVFGWWSYNKISEEIVSKHGLSMPKYFDYYNMHDYDLVKG
jgi:hypothetical protein